MSVVPYVNDRQIVLRHDDSIVLLDPQSKRLDVASQRGLNVAECPYCHQPLRGDDTSRAPDHEDTSPGQDIGFVSPEYFRMLQESLPSSANSSVPPSPRRRLVEPVRRARDSPRAATSYEDEISAADGGSSQNAGISASAFSPGYFKRFFVEEKELGRGGKGIVFLLTHVLDNVPLGQYACKRVPVGNDHTWLTNVLNEVRLLEHLSHHHLVYYKHVWLEDVKISTFGPSVPCVFILQQYCNSGNLHEYIMNATNTVEPTHSLKERVRRRSKEFSGRPQDIQGRKLRFEEIYSFFKDITSGLNHLHVNGFIHRDLKPSNCLLHSTAQGFRVLVSDFGEVQLENVVRRSTGATGTVSYCAPEVLRQDPATGSLQNFTTKSDIFSLGMILYFLCFARLPYKNADYVNEENEDLDLLREEIVTWTGLHGERKLRPDLPEQLYTFLRRLLSLNAADRPTAEEVLLGIKTGSGLDQISDSRPSKASHFFDDLSASSRISPVDSPRPNTPARKLSSTFNSHPHQRPSPTKLRFPSYQREHSSSSPLSTPSTPLRDDEGDGDSSGVRGRVGSLVLRPPFPSPTRSDESPAAPQRAPKQSLLPNHWHPADLHSSSLFRSLKLLLFVCKAVSLNLLCSPMATHSTALYSLLGLAATDFFFISPDRGEWKTVSLSAFLLIMHVAIVLGLWRKDALCLKPGVPYWSLE